jgi:antitoxin VapB
VHQKQLHTEVRVSRPKTATAGLFMHGRSQAVRLPRTFWFEGNEVRAIRVGNRVILEPLAQTGQIPWAEIDALCTEPFMPEDLEQPRWHPERTLFDT